IPTAGPHVVDIHIGSNAVPIASPIVATATVVTPYSRRKGKEDNYSKIYKFQSQQRRPWTKKHKKDYYMTVIRNNLGWKVKDFKEKSPEEILEEKIKEMMQLVPIEEVYVQSLQVKHHIIDWKVHIEGQQRYWKIIRLGGSSACYQFFVDLLKHLDREDLNQLWNYMHAPIEWKLYDLSEVHHVTAKDNEIFMLVEKDYPLRKGLALVMICYKLQVENFSQMANDLVLKIYKIANSPRHQGD
nr:hypothetical protein [Tanacetum cinerariifolium]